MQTKDQKKWNNSSHEIGVERFYSSGIEGYHDYHKGYLSFGYWTQDGMTYEDAAENLVKTLAQKLKLNEKSLLLDIGPGMGIQDIYLVQKFNPQKISALDATWKHVEIARERAKKEKIGEGKLRFHHGTAVEIPFKNETFTHALSIEVLEHVDTREKALMEIYRVLKPGGVIVVSDYTLPRQPKNIFEKIFINFVTKIWHMPMANVYSNDVYKDKLQKMGFKNITIENVGKDVIPGYYFEHRRPESIKAMRELRGFWAGVVGSFLIDFTLYHLYKINLCEYVFMRAEK